MLSCHIHFIMSADYFPIQITTWVVLVLPFSGGLTPHVFALFQPQFFCTVLHVFTSGFNHSKIVCVSRNREWKHVIWGQNLGKACWFSLSPRSNTGGLLLMLVHFHIQVSPTTAWLSLAQKMNTGSRWSLFLSSAEPSSTSSSRFQFKWIFIINVLHG